MRQELNLTQTQKLSEKMIQSLQILQMNTQELEEYLKEKELENPLIELEENSGDSEEQNDFQEKLEWLAKSDEQNRIYYQDEQNEQREEREFLEEERGLPEYVLSQLIPFLKTEKDSEIYEFLAYSLDERGYLIDNVEELADKFFLSVEEMKVYIDRLKKCDPMGVGAADLKECLLLQLLRRENENQIVKQIVEHYLVELGKNQIPQIAKALKISRAEVVKACEEIRKLNPKPAQGFASRNHLSYLVPDVTVVKFKEYFEIILNERNAYNRPFSSYYLSLMKEDSSIEVKEYLQEKYKQAQWIFQCVASRKDTMMKICRILVEEQKEFFEKGSVYLKPLRMQELAKKAGIHESTVSRAVKEKYLQCSWGIFPINYFFAQSVSAKETQIKDAVRKELQRIIEQENKSHPLSDQKIAEKMQEKGISISRRTVAKYRGQMGIADAGGRKVYL